MNSILVPTAIARSIVQGPSHMIMPSCLRIFHNSSPRKQVRKPNKDAI